MLRHSCLLVSYPKALTSPKWSLNLPLLPISTMWPWVLKDYSGTQHKSRVKENLLLSLGSAHLRQITVSLPCGPSPTYYMLPTVHLWPGILQACCFHWHSASSGDHFLSMHEPIITMAAALPRSGSSFNRWIKLLQTQWRHLKSRDKCWNSSRWSTTQVMASSVKNSLFSYCDIYLPLCLPSNSLFQYSLSG